MSNFIVNNFSNALSWVTHSKHIFPSKLMMHEVNETLNLMMEKVRVRFLCKLNEEEEKRMRMRIFLEYFS